MQPSAASPGVGQQADGADAEENERGGFGRRSQEKGMFLPAGIEAIAHDLPIVVDGSAHLKRPTRSENQVVQVHDSPGIAV